MSYFFIRFRRSLAMTLFCCFVLQSIIGHANASNIRIQTHSKNRRNVITIRGKGGGVRQHDETRRRPSAVMEGMKNSLASALASCCAKTLLQPFDTIKTIQQYERTITTSSIGFFEASRIVMKRDGGFWELYAGLVVSALGSVPAIGLYYGIYSYCKRILIPLLLNAYGSSSELKRNQGSDQTLKLIAVAISAALGNTVASFSRVPYEVVKQKLQTGEYSSTIIALSSMFKAQGFRAFFPVGGIATQMIRDIPYAIFTLMSYEYLREAWVDKSPKPWKDMVTGGMAGGIGSYLTNPMDVIKTRLQTDPEMFGGSVLQCISMTYEEGGYRAFLRGSMPRLIHKIPGNAIFFFFFELFKRLLRVDTASIDGKTSLKIKHK